MDVSGAIFEMGQLFVSLMLVELMSLHFVFLVRIMWLIAHGYACFSVKVQVFVDFAGLVVYGAAIQLPL